MPYIHNELYHSLQEVLRHPRCASRTWLEDPTFDLGPLRIRNTNVSTRFWSEKNIDPLPIAFPAILNLKGAYSNITFDIDVENLQYVRRIIILNQTLKLRLKTSILSHTETTSTYGSINEGHVSTLSIIRNIFKRCGYPI